MSNRHGMNTPLTPQTDPNNFPPLRFGDDAIKYPKMLLKEATPEDVEENKQRRVVDPTTNTPLDPQWRPIRVGQKIPMATTFEHLEMGIGKVIGEPLIVRNPEEEFRVTGVRPDVGHEPYRPSEGAPLSVASLQDRRIEAVENGLAEMRSMMGEMLTLIRKPPSANTEPPKEETAQEAAQDSDPMMKPRRGRPPGKRPQVDGTVIEGD